LDIFLFKENITPPLSHIHIIHHYLNHKTV
jgi:hypothetical protein